MYVPWSTLTLVRAKPYEERYFKTEREASIHTRAEEETSHKTHTSIINTWYTYEYMHIYTRYEGVLLIVPDLRFASIKKMFFLSMLDI